MTRHVAEFVRVLNTPCRDHAVLISRTLDGRASRTTRAALRAHFLLCAPCRRLHRQLDIVDRVAGELVESAGLRGIEQPAMPTDVRSRLARRFVRRG